jgi:hypothetical protein
MKPTLRLLSPLFAVVLFLSQVMTACTGNEPVFKESGPPETRLVVKTDPWDNCDTAGNVTRVLGTTNKRTQETEWSLEGKAGVGGKIPLGFLIPSLDIEAAITSHYGSKETRTWEYSYSDTFDVPGYTKSVLLVFYQEITQKGTLQIYNKKIGYDYPAELTILGHRKVDVACDPPLIFHVRCGFSSDSIAALPPSYNGIAGTWRLSSPSNGEIVTIDVEIQDLYVIIHVQTDGSSGVADWGRHYECIWSDPLETTFNHLIFKNTTLTFHPISNGELRLTVVDTYIDPPVAIPPQTTEYLFTR